MSDIPQHPQAIVSCGSLEFRLDPGDGLTFGRGHGNDLRLGHSPLDLRVSRFAGRLECRRDGVLVHNLSSRRELVVRTFPGPQYEIGPLMLAGTQPYDRVHIHIVGEVATYAIAVDTRALAAPSGDPRRDPAFETDARTAGFDRIESMSPRQRLLLTALCLPLMTRSGERATVPTYAEMEVILRENGHSIKAHTIRNGLDELRTWLTNEHRVDGLLRTDGPSGAGRGANTTVALARWAIVSGNVTDEDLDALGG